MKNMPGKWLATFFDGNSPLPNTIEGDVGVQANLFIRGGVFSYWGIPYSEAVKNEIFCRKLTYIQYLDISLGPLAVF